MPDGRNLLLHQLGLSERALRLPYSLNGNLLDLNSKPCGKDRLTHCTLVL